MILAQTLRDSVPEVSIAEARAALAAFEDLGAGRGADSAAALLRALGVRVGRVGTRGSSALTKREQEIFLLLGEGMSNPDIAARLVLSRKTVEHHVASILAKLGLSSRSAAAAEAVRGAMTDRAQN
ncbi:MAG TPA: helix-turn-helix transcriptional regulator [Nocardioidaceae bacterium]|nr:helix-turn-helix transcriptional regulator [Nocardioidaceae bacterium]